VDEEAKRPKRAKEGAKEEAKSEEGEGGGGEVEARVEGRGQLGEELMMEELDAAAAKRTTCLKARDRIPKEDRGKKRVVEGYEGRPKPEAEREGAGGPRRPDAGGPQQTWYAGRKAGQTRDENAQLHGTAAAANSKQKHRLRAGRAAQSGRRRRMCALPCCV
jgi:hypothetical protein